MAPLKLTEWRKLPLSLTDLCIDTTLRCGQSFRWRKLQDEWTCTLSGRIVSLKQDKTHLQYRISWPIEDNATRTRESALSNSPRQADEDDSEELLRHYLSLNVDLASLYEQWSKADPVFRKKAPAFAGVRILSQDAWETLICFICSSNNNISRISQMVHKLCKNYGPLIGYIGDEPFHDFPRPEDLLGKDVESELRNLGFGYRAKYIAATSRMVAEKPSDWLTTLRSPRSPGFGTAVKTEPCREITYKEARQELQELAGVGPKVADCVCLMGLGWGEAVPVDTHVWQIAQRDYKFGKGKSKTFSIGMYDSVGDFFREIWGTEAGWAHSVLFTADLKAFSGQKTPRDLPDIKVEVKEEPTGDVVVQSRKRTRRTTIVKNEVELESQKTEGRRTRARK